MARPLPKDIEVQIKGASSRALSLSHLIVGFMLGAAFGFGLAAAMMGDGQSEIPFALGVVVIAAVWFFAARAKKSQPVMTPEQD